MTDTQAELAPAASPKDAVAAPLGAHASRGAMWAIVQTFASKGTTVVSQLVLGYILLEKQYGLAGLAFTFLSLATITSRFGLTEVLVQRHEKFEYWATAAFWMSLFAGLLSFGLVALTALVAGRYYHDMDLCWLILLVGLIVPLDSLCTCPMAKLQKDFRFRTQNLITFAANVVQSVLTIALALLHWGPYAVIVPRPIIFLMQAILYWCVAPVAIRPTLDRKRWKALWGDGGALTMATYSGTIVSQGDNFTLSLFHPLRVVGIYYFAFNLSTQTSQLVATNLTQTFFSILSKLKFEVSRQTDAFLRAAKLVSMIMIPLCMLQAAVAGPMLRFLWGNKWESAITVLQVLSIGMAFASTQGITAALLQAQGRFRFQLKWQLLSAAVFLSCVFCGALSGGALAVAVSVLVYDIVWYPVSAFMAVRPAKVPFDRIIQIYAGPMIYAAIACIIPWAAEMGGRGLIRLLLPLLVEVVLPDRVFYLLQCVAIAGLVLPGYALLMFALRPRDAAMITTQMEPLLGRMGIPSKFLRVRGDSSGDVAAGDLLAQPAVQGRWPQERPVKILWVIDGWEIYGARRAVVSLIDAVRSRGWEAQAISVQRGDCATHLEKTGVQVTYLDVANPAGLQLATGGLARMWQAVRLVVQQLKLSRRVREIVRSSGASAVHVIDKNVLTVAAWAAKREKKVCLWEMVSIVGTGYPGDLNQRLHASLIERFAIIPLANSRFTARTLERVKSAVPVMYLGADTRRFDPARRFDVSREQLGIPAEALLFTIAARVDQSKGQAVFLDSILRTPRSDVHLLIVGALPGAPEVAELQQMAAAAGASERLHFVDFTTEPEAYLAISDVIVNARLDPEPFGLSTVEGMMMGKPLLVHALGGPAETVIDGESGWHVTIPTVEGFAAGIARALADQPRWRAMGEAARRRALEHFSLEAQTRWYQRTVLQALESRQVLARDMVEGSGGR